MPQIQMSDIISPEHQALLQKQMTDSMSIIEREISNLPKEKRDEVRPLIEIVKDVEMKDSNKRFETVQQIFKILQK
jgi:hypothetical protein